MCACCVSNSSSRSWCLKSASHLVGPVRVARQRGEQHCPIVVQKYEVAGAGPVGVKWDARVLEPARGAARFAKWHTAALIGCGWLPCRMSAHLNSAANTSSLPPSNTISPLVRFFTKLHTVQGRGRRVVNCQAGAASAGTHVRAALTACTPRRPHCRRRRPPGPRPGCTQVQPCQKKRWSLKGKQLAKLGGR